ncbi:MmcQ/YjbR family DNA-binding protein [Streptomyces chromofuscus]|uniref:MmcQ/YjbR family DNA-binding protein n=1 Tax=Streptomyces chromofuscus TaxID=42881 RepID=A0A7M2TCY1_STRCW|nr:MmcQ/YjbR family DNA-binding protein [Streptomyces chromofuscus]QOV46586.1 MmcQ/YjbR family DNA-binding protein [Streptomyces chromofuscus]GGT07929.1 DNA-binding protein [Streptomyces chromofuscus]
MTPQELRVFCLSFNAAVEDFPFGPEASVFKVLGKMFALSVLDARPLTVNLKCDPEDAVRLRADHPGLITPGWHMNKRHWNTVTVDGPLPDRLVRELIEDSYDLVVAGLPRAERLRLDRP